MLRKLLTFSALVEMATGLALMIVPEIVVRLLLGGNAAGEGMPLASFAGIALLALGFACWPSGQSGTDRSPAFRGMVTYNALVALFLAYLSLVEHVGGVLLWPAVVLHAIVALLLVWAWRADKGTPW